MSHTSAVEPIAPAGPPTPRDPGCRSAANLRADHSFVVKRLQLQFGKSGLDLSMALQSWGRQYVVQYWQPE